MDMNEYQGTAIDPEIFRQVEVAEPEQMDANETIATETEENPVSDVANETVEEPVSTPEPTEPTKYNIEGVGEFTADELKEWKNAGLRQSDYTRKTQELARQREELKDASNIYNYLKEHPYIIDSINRTEGNPTEFTQSAPTPERQMIQKLAYNQKAMQTDLKLTELHQKYGDFDETQLFQTAVDKKIEDLEFVLKGMMYDNKRSDASSVQTAKEQLRAELESDRDTVSTIISSKANKKGHKPSLTPEEKKVAANFGLSESEYLKWK